MGLIEGIGIGIDSQKLQFMQALKLIFIDFKFLGHKRSERRGLYKDFEFKYAEGGEIL